MIDAFSAFRDAADFEADATDKLIELLVANSKLPTYQTRTWDGEDSTKEYTPIAEEDRTDEQKESLARTRSLLDGKFADDVLWESHDDLYELVTKYPPELLEEVLILGMVVYMLRASNVKYNPETKAFNEFYRGWSSLVVSD